MSVLYVVPVKGIIETKTVSTELAVRYVVENLDESCVRAKEIASKIGISNSRLYSLFSLESVKEHELQFVQLVKQASSMFLIFTAKKPLSFDQLLALIILCFLPLGSDIFNEPYLEAICTNIVLIEEPK